MTVGNGVGSAMIGGSVPAVAAMMKSISAVTGVSPEDFSEKARVAR
jgi:hypothetical protein